MKKAYVLLNHQLTDNQIKELNKIFRCEQIIYPDRELSDKWSSIAPVSELDMDTIKEVINWLDSSSMDDVLVIIPKYELELLLIMISIQKKVSYIQQHTSVFCQM